jgi:transcriptional regulator with XRE-family HTH domain
VLNRLDHGYLVMSKRAVLDPKQTFLDLLRECREASGQSQEELASRIAWRQSDVSKVERGVRRIDVLELRLWLAALEQPFGTFVHELDRRLSARSELQSRWTR